MAWAVNSKFAPLVIVVAIGTAAVAGCIYAPPDDSSKPKLQAPVGQVAEPARLSPEELSKLKKYAEAYGPRSGREVIPSPPVPDEEISRIVSKAASSGVRDHEKFIILIFLRISRFQIVNFKQRYELGRTNPLTIEFYRLIDRSDFERAEIMPAYLADIYVEENPELLSYDLVAVEMKRIARAGKRIRQDSDNTRVKKP